MFVFFVYLALSEKDSHGMADYFLLVFSELIDTEDTRTKNNRNKYE